MNDLKFAPEDLQKYTIGGIPIRDLVIFADACDRNGVTFNSIKRFAENVDSAREYALQTIRDEIKAEIDKIRRSK